MSTFLSSSLKDEKKCEATWFQGDNIPEVWALMGNTVMPKSPGPGDRPVSKAGLPLKNELHTKSRRLWDRQLAYKVGMSSDRI